MALLGFKAGVCPGRVDKTDNRQVEFVRQFHQAERFAVSLRKRAAKVAFKIGFGVPALLRAAKLQKKASKVGFDWPTTTGIAEKIDEELAEVREELEKHEEGTPASPDLQAEIGDLLFIVTNLARKLGVDPEVALEGTNEKFLHRFDQIEKGLKKDGITLEDATLEQMDIFWNGAK